MEFLSIIHNNQLFTLKDTDNMEVVFQYYQKCTKILHFLINVSFQDSHIIYAYLRFYFEQKAKKVNLLF